MAATVLLRLAALTGEGRYRGAAERALATAGPFLARYPTSFAQWLVALEFAHADVVEVALVGAPDDRRRGRCATSSTRGFQPFRVVAAVGRRRARRASRCWRTGSRSTAGRPRTCAGRSPAAGRSPTPEALAEQLAAP